MVFVLVRNVCNQKGKKFLSLEPRHRTVRTGHNLCAYIYLRRINVDVRNAYFFRFTSHTTQIGHKLEVELKATNQN